MIGKPIFSWIFCVFFICFICIATTAAEIPPIDKQITIGPIEGYHRYYIHIYNVDDNAKVKVNGQLIKTMSFEQDSGWIEITAYLIEGDNTIELTDENGPESGWAYGFELKRDDSNIWSDSCGIAGSIGCEYNDITRGLVYRKIITLKLATVSPTFIDKKIALGPYDSYQRFYIRMHKDLDDNAKVRVNGQPVATMSFRQDSGWIEITAYLIEGDNTIELTYENAPESGWAYGFELKRNDSIIWDDSCGIIGSIGCKDDDATKGLVYRNIIMLNQTAFSSTPVPELALTAKPALKQIPAKTPISTPAPEAQSTNLVQKIMGVLFIAISAYILLKWLAKILNTPKK
jgi:hypothetical protein